MTDRRWTSEAACKPYPSRWWDDADRTSRAVAICQTCPVRTACLRHALTTGEQYGVWGGLAAHERRTEAA